MNEKNVAVNEKGVAVNKKPAAKKARKQKVTVKKASKPSRSAASSSVNGDRPLDAFETGQSALQRMLDDWDDAHIDTSMGEFETTSQKLADNLAQKLARSLEHYLSSCPPQERLSLTGEVIRGILYKVMSLTFRWEPKALVPMAKHATTL